MFNCGFRLERCQSPFCMASAIYFQHLYIFFSLLALTDIIKMEQTDLYPMLSTFHIISSNNFYVLNYLYSKVFEFTDAWGFITTYSH